MDLGVQGSRLTFLFRPMLAQSLALRNYNPATTYLWTGLCLTGLATTSLAHFSAGFV
jgi:hypothetical protein